jgi:TetR/AcrR family transcriptional regulator, regulator of biofilm formation and stress response
MVEQMYQAPRGEARREAILRATLAVIGERGADAVTHRAVAERAGAPLSATTYWFSSRDELLEDALRLAAREEVERLERVVVELAPRQLSPAEWAEAVAAELAGDVERDPERHVALAELALEAGRRPRLREEVERWHAAHLRVAALGLRAAGSDDPAADAPIVVATLSGLILAQLSLPAPGFEREVLRPALERLFSRLVGGRAAP